METPDAKPNWSRENVAVGRRETDLEVILASWYHRYIQAAVPADMVYYLTFGRVVQFLSFTRSTLPASSHTIIKKCKSTKDIQEKTMLVMLAKLIWGNKVIQRHPALKEAVDQNDWLKEIAMPAEPFIKIAEQKLADKKRQAEDKVNSAGPSNSKKPRQKTELGAELVQPPAESPRQKRQVEQILIAQAKADMVREKSDSEKKGTDQAGAEEIRNKLVTVVQPQILNEIRDLLQGHEGEMARIVNRLDVNVGNVVKEVMAGHRDDVKTTVMGALCMQKRVIDVALEEQRQWIAAELAKFADRICPQRVDDF